MITLEKLLTDLKPESLNEIVGGKKARKKRYTTHGSTTRTTKKYTTHGSTTRTTYKKPAKKK